MASFALPQAAVAEIDRTIALYPERQAAMLLVLWTVQREAGWISPDAMV